MNWKCKLFGHKGSENGGIFFYWCPRCKRSLPQTNPTILAAAPRILALEEEDPTKALAVYREAVMEAGGDPGRPIVGPIGDEANFEGKDPWAA